MNRTSHLILPALVLAGALALTACGGETDTAGAGSSSGKASGQHGGGHSTDGTSHSAEGSEADVAFAAGMIPHHAQAVEMSEIILAKSPPAEVAAIATRIRDAQTPEIDELETILADLGESSDPAEHSEHGGGHGGMMTDAELAELEAATGNEAASLYLQLMIEHHEGAIEASEKQIAAGKHEPAIALARQIQQAQETEIAQMQALLKSL